MEAILLIVPSRKMKEMAERVITDLGIVINIEVGANQDVPALLQKYPSVGVIISRGGTAEEVGRLSKKTVIGITATVSDLLEPIHRLVLAGITKIGVIAKWNMMDDQPQDILLGNIEILLRHWQHDDELQRTIEAFRKDGVGGVVGDRKGAEIGEQYGLASEFFDSGMSALKKAINEAVKIVRAQEQERQRENERAQQIQGHARQIHSVLEQVAAAIEELTASAQELAATSQVSSDIVSAVDQEVNKTSEILGIIRRVAKQTDMLGLNAAIEAARAGPLGRGFSVVADEVRKLADETNHSAAGIGTLLNDFRSSVSKVRQNVEQSGVITQEQAKATQEIAKMLEGLRVIGQELMEMAVLKS